MGTGVHLDTLAEVLRDAHQVGLQLTGVQLTPDHVPHTHGGEGARRIGPGAETSWTQHVHERAARKATHHSHHEHWKVLSPVTKHKLHHKLQHTTALCTPYDKLRVAMALDYLYPGEGALHPR